MAGVAVRRCCDASFCYANNDAVIMSVMASDGWRITRRDRLLIDSSSYSAWILAGAFIELDKSSIEFAFWFFETKGFYLLVGNSVAGIETGRQSTSDSEFIN